MCSSNHTHGVYGLFSGYKETKEVAAHTGLAEGTSRIDRVTAASSCGLLSASLCYELEDFSQLGKETHVSRHCLYERLPETQSHSLVHEDTEPETKWPGAGWPEAGAEGGSQC